jgi:hypothetical protein
MISTIAQACVIKILLRKIMRVHKWVKTCFQTSDKDERATKGLVRIFRPVG